IRDLIVTGVQTCALPISSTASIILTPAGVIMRVPLQSWSSGSAPPVSGGTISQSSFSSTASDYLGTFVDSTNVTIANMDTYISRSEERRVGKESRTRVWR